MEGELLPQSHEAHFNYLCVLPAHTWVSQLFITSEAIFVIATFTSKAAVLLTVEKLLARDMRERTIFQYTLGAVGILGVASVLAVTIDCVGQNCNQVRYTPMHSKTISN